MNQSFNSEASKVSFEVPKTGEPENEARNTKTSSGARHGNARLNLGSGTQRMFNHHVEDRSDPGDTNSSTAFLTVYDPRLESFLSMYGILAPVDCKAPANELELKEMLCRRRNSLSPQVFDADSRYQSFYKAYECAEDEAAELQIFLEHVSGANHSFRGGMHLRFSQLAPLTESGSGLQAPEPVAWDGTRPVGKLDVGVHVQLAHYIQPTKHGSAILPTFAIEQDHFGSDAKTRLSYDLAAGARAVDSLLNYGSVTNFDRRARSLGITLVDGNVRHFSTHREVSTGARSLEYHTYQFGGNDMLASKEQYVEAVTAVRNMREYCDCEREAAIQVANVAQRELVLKTPDLGIFSPSPSTLSPPSARQQRRNIGTRDRAKDRVEAEEAKVENFGEGEH